MKFFSVILVLLLIILGELFWMVGKVPEEKEEKAKTVQNRFHGDYQKRNLLSQKGKFAYQMLKEMADELGYTVFIKVRLTDLLEAVKEHKYYSLNLSRISGKYVDFVVCDKNLDVRYVVELNPEQGLWKPDVGEEAPVGDDATIDAILRSAGYKVIHADTITEAIQKELSEKQA